MRTPSGCAAVLVLLAACGESPVTPERRVSIPAGRWASAPAARGYQVVLEVGPHSSEWSDPRTCLVVRLSGALSMDATGRFEAEGLATRLDGSEMDTPARLRGVVLNGEMTVEIRRLGKGDGSYRLRRGEPSVFPAPGCP